MSTNLVSTIMQSLSSEAIGKIASALGLDTAAAQKGISAGIPGILAGLANAASTSDGAQRLQNAVARVEDRPGHDILGGLLSGNTQTLAESGLNIISSLLGGNSLSTLTSVIAQFAGLGQGSAKKLLGFLAPLVLGFLKREQVSQGLDSRGLVSLLADQRGNIERAMPAGVARNLASAEARPLNQPTSQPASSDRFRRPAVTAEPKTSSRSWAYWLIPALIAAGVAVYLLPQQEQTRTAQDVNKTTGGTATAGKDTAQLSPSQAQPSPSTPPTAASLETDILSNISRLRASLQNIKDTASAQGALGDIKDISAQLGRIKAMAQQLSPEARKAIAATVASRVPDLNGLIDRIGNEVNLSSDVKPAMDNLKSELLSISKV